MRTLPHLITVDECEGLSTREVHKLYRSYVNRSQVSLMTSFGFGQELADHAEGCWIYTRDGRRILDFTGGVGVLNHGHNHPRVLAARKKFQELRRMEVHKTYFSPYVAALGHNLAELLPADLSMSFFPNSGAEAVEGAVKLAYRYHEGKRGTILHADIGFHGRLLGSGSLTGGAPHQFRYPGIPGARAFRFGDLDSVRAGLERSRTTEGGCDVYAIIIEPVSASAMRFCSEDFLRGLRRICADNDIILVLDEIYTGWGKTGSLFYFMRYPGLVPDILTTSKSLGGGKSSISAYVARAPVFRKAYDNLADALVHSTSTTYYGFGEETATAIEAINIVIEDDYPARARALEAVLAPGLARISKEYPEIVSGVCGAGALHGVFFDAGPRVLHLAAKLAPGGLARDPRFRTKLVISSIVDALYRDHGIYAYYGLGGDNPLVVAPPLVAEPEQAEYFLECFQATLATGLTSLLTRFVREKVKSLW